MKSRLTRLPGVCIVCGAPVTWNGKRWLDSPIGRGMGVRHVCREDRTTCGVWMIQARERCARRPGHLYDHRTRFALDTAADRRRKWAV